MSSRRWTPAILVLMAGLGFLLTWSVVFNPGSSGPKRTPIPEVPAEERVGTSPTLAGSRTAPPGSALPGRPDTARTLDVAVLDRDGGAPLAEADVRLLADSPLARKLGEALAGDVLTSARTTPEGHSLLDVPKDSRPTRVVASRAGYVTRAVDVEGEPSTLEVRLERGSTISGRVETAKQTGVAGIQVVALESRAISEEGRYLAGLPPTVARTTALSDAGGRFEIGGLPSGVYTLLTESDDWSFRGARKPHTNWGVKTGTSDLVLLVEPVRMFRLRLKDDANGLPVTTKPTAVTPLAEAGELRLAPRRETAAYEGRRISMQDLGEEEPDVVLGGVRMDADAPLPERVRVVLHVEGYESGWAWVTLRTLKDLVERPVYDEVRLKPGRAGDVGTVVVRCVREPRAFESSRPCVLRVPPAGETVAARADRVRQYGNLQAGVQEFDRHFRGRAAGGDEWEFVNVPVGRHEVDVSDGTSTSPAFDVDVRAGDVARASAVLPPPSGLLLVVEDESGRPVPDAQLNIEFVSGGDEFARPGTSWPASRGLVGRVDANGVSQAGFEPLRPSRYAIRVMKVGFEPARQEFDVSKAEVATLRVALRSK